MEMTTKGSHFPCNQKTICSKCCSLMHWSISAWCHISTPSRVLTALPSSVDASIKHKSSILFSDYSSLKSVWQTVRRPRAGWAEGRVLSRVDQCRGFVCMSTLMDCCSATVRAPEFLATNELISYADKKHVGLLAWCLMADKVFPV